MLHELLMRDIAALNSVELEEECRELEDAYAEALMDNAGVEVLSPLWKRIQELNRAMMVNHGFSRERVLQF